MATADTRDVSLEYHSYAKEVEKALREASRRALLFLGRKIRDRARQIVPFDTAALSASLKYGVKKSKKHDGFYLWVASGAGAEGRHYGMFNEWAAQNRRVQPFLNPAAKESFASIPAIFREHADKEAKKQARAAARRAKLK